MERYFLQEQKANIVQLYSSCDGQNGIHEHNVQTCTIQSTRIYISNHYRLNMIFAGPLFLQIYTVPGLCLLWTQNPLICLLGIVYPLAESIHKINKDGTDFRGVAGQIFL